MMTKKKQFSILTLAVLTALLLPCAAFPHEVFADSETQAEAGFSNFSNKREYTDNQFLDVPSARWFAPAVKSVYSLGIMSGKNASTFAPNANIKIGEAISMAAKTRHLYNGGDGVLPKTAKTGQRWYTDAVNYAVSCGIIKSGDFSNYEADATRAQLAYIFSGAVPEEALPPIAAVDTVPDVTASTPYRERILLLYRAGVVSGTDKIGSFHPNQKITRGEAASILSLIAVPQNRKCTVLGSPSPGSASGAASGTPGTAPAVSDFPDTSGVFFVSAAASFRDAYQSGDAPQINGRPTTSDSPTLYLIQSVFPEQAKASESTDTGIDTGTGTKIKPQTTGELFGYLSKKSEAEAPLSIFHRLTVESLASRLNAFVPSEAVRVSLSDGKPAYVSALTSRSLDSARYWVLTADEGDSFVTLIGRVGLAQPTERVNEMLYALLSLRLS